MPIGLQKGIVMTMLRDAGSLKNDKKFNMREIVIDTETTGLERRIRDLVKIKSIGPEIATVLVGEVFYRQFDNRQQLGSYVGLTPSHFQSGSMSLDQGISKAGNPKTRTTMIELASMWLRFQPNSALSLWFRERVGSAKGRYRCGRTLAVDLSVAISRDWPGADGRRSVHLKALMRVVSIN